MESPSPELRLGDHQLPPPYSGASYTLERVPIGSTDFSLSLYSYDESPGDRRLANFSLHTMDTLYKVGLLYC